MTLLQVVYVHNKTQATIQSLIDVYNSLWEDSEYGQAINKPKYLAVLETSSIHNASKVSPINLQRQGITHVFINGSIIDKWECTLTLMKHIKSIDSSLTHISITTDQDIYFTTGKLDEIQDYIPSSIYNWQWNNDHSYVQLDEIHRTSDCDYSFNLFERSFCFDKLPLNPAGAYWNIRSYDFAELTFSCLSKIGRSLEAVISLDGILKIGELYVNILQIYASPSTSHSQGFFIRNNDTLQSTHSNPNGAPSLPSFNDILNIAERNQILPKTIKIMVEEVSKFLKKKYQFDYMNFCLDEDVIIKYLKIQPKLYTSNLTYGIGTISTSYNFNLTESKNLITFTSTKSGEKPKINFSISDIRKSLINFPEFRHMFGKQILTLLKVIPQKYWINHG